MGQGLRLVDTPRNVLSGKEISTDNGNLKGKNFWGQESAMRGEIRVNLLSTRTPAVLLVKR